MSNVLKDQCTFFPVPRAFVDGGKVRDLSGSAVKLYMVLLGLGQKHSAPVIQLPGYELRDYTGLSSATAITARDELKAAGLIDWKTGPSGVMTYMLLNPENLAPLPKPKDRSGVRRHRPRPKTIKPSRPTTIESPSVVPPTWDELNSEQPQSQVFRKERPVGGSGLQKLKTMSLEIKDPVFRNQRPFVQNENNASELEARPLSEYTSEEGISEHDSEQEFDSKLNPKGYECNVHGKDVQFVDGLCGACHPEVFNPFG